MLTHGIPYDLSSILLLGYDICMYKGPVLWDTTVYAMCTYMYVPHELFNRIDQEYMCREHIQCTIIRVLLFVPHVYMCKCSVCVCVDLCMLWIGCMI